MKAGLAEIKQENLIGAMIVGKSDNPLLIANLIFKLEANGHPINIILVDKSQGASAAELKRELNKFGFKLRQHIKETGNLYWMANWSEQGKNIIIPETMPINNFLHCIKDCQEKSCYEKPLMLWHNDIVNMDFERCDSLSGPTWHKGFNWEAALIQGLGYIEKSHDNNWLFMKYAKLGKIVPGIGFSNMGDGIYIEDPDHLVPSFFQRYEGKHKFPKAGGNHTIYRVYRGLNPLKDVSHE